MSPKRKPEQNKYPFIKDSFETDEFDALNKLLKTERIGKEDFISRIFQGCITELSVTKYDDDITCGLRTLAHEYLRFRVQHYGSKFHIEDRVESLSGAGEKRLAGKVCKKIDELLGKALGRGEGRG